MDVIGARPSGRGARGAAVAAFVVVLAGVLLWTTTRPRAPEVVVDDPAVAAYLTAVAALEQDRADELDELFTTLLSTYATPEVALVAFADAAETIGVARTIAEARRLTPPDSLAPAHDAWVDTLAIGQDVSAQLIDAAERGDMLAVARAAASLERAEIALAYDVPPAFCRTLLVASPPPDVPCDDPSTLPAGAYGRDVHALVARVAIDVFTRIGWVMPSLSADQELQYLAEIQPIVERTFAEVAREVEALTPPGSLRADQAALVGYLEDMAGIAADITAAAEAGDREALARLYDASGEPLPALRDQLSEEGRRLLAPLLVGEG